jgi:putative photosynthetic complex assembly protein
MSDQTNTTPTAIGFRGDRDREMIPTTLLRAMFALAMASLLIVGWASFTGREPVGQPKPAEVLASTPIVLEGGGSKAVRVLDAEGAVLADLDHGGFITVIQNGLQRERMKNGLAATLPVNLVRYANGRLAVEDPATGWSVELGNFGADNKAAFERLVAGN